MKLTFDKKDDNFIVKIGEKEFSTKDYVEMIKVVKNGGKIEGEYTKEIVAEEKASVESMLNRINGVTESNDSVPESAGEDEEINPEDIPF